MYISKFCVYIVFIILLCFPFSCKKQENVYGLVLMIDDGYIDQWYEVIDFLDQYDSKLTFYISNFHKLSNTQINKLKQFRDRGHEIGFHGTHHLCATEYLSNYTCNEYMEYEIFPDLALMRKAGFTVKHFAYPYGCNSTESDSVLLKHLKSVRKLAWTSKENPLPNQNQIYYTKPVNHEVLRAAGIDIEYNVTIEDIEQSIDRIAENQECLLLYCHKLSNVEGKWNISPKKVKRIVEYCYSKRIPMITVEDLYQIN